MKRLELFFTFLQLPLDYLMLVLAGFTAFSLRYTSFVTEIRPVLFSLHWKNYWPLVLVVAGFWIIIFALSGLYATDPNRKLAKELSRVFLASSTAFAGITVYVFFTLQKFDSRFLVLAGWILAIIYVSGARISLRLLKMFLYKNGFGLRKTVIIGQELVSLQLKNTYEKRPELGHLVLGVFEHFTQETADKILSLHPDEIIFTDPKTNQDETLSAVDFANDNHLSFKYSADLFATISSNMSISTVAGIPIVELRRTRLSGWGRIAKRATDILGSVFLLILFSPIFLIIYILILAETGWPIFYKNERVGLERKKIFIYKFRTMFQKDCTGEQFGASGEEAVAKEEELIKNNNVKSGPVYKIRNDPRVTRLGKFLRRFSLDELPQFINILKGEMSLVGPRPHQPREVEKYEKKHKTVLAIRPGLTGLAQISGRSDLSFEEEINLDTFYMENWNLFLDFIIIIKTPFAVLFKKGAY